MNDQKYAAIMLGPGPAGGGAAVPIAGIAFIAQAFMAQSGRSSAILHFVNTTFNYPIMADAHRVAALNGLNRLA
ncbi:MAG: hypothetical protein JNK31_01120 [Candidatus Competibacter sp.]|nr:hypothetical protein [Candidatus Competibacter sp.]